MTMDAYISKLSKAAFFQLRRLAQLRSYVSPKDAESLVHAFITSRLDYCNALFAGLPLHSISHLYIQNSAARILTHTKRSAHITPILIKLHWLPVSSRITYKILLLTFKSLNGLAPPYLSDLLSPYVPPRSLRSLGCELLISFILNGWQIIFRHCTYTMELYTSGTKDNNLSLCI